MIQCLFDSEHDNWCSPNGWRNPSCCSNRWSDASDKRASSPRKPGWSLLWLSYVTGNLMETSGAAYEQDKETNTCMSWSLCLDTSKQLQFQ